MELFWGNFPDLEDKPFTEGKCPQGKQANLLHSKYL